MRTLLIVFVVLLFLLTLLSSFGGSIRPAEPFFDAVPADMMPSYEGFSYSDPQPPTYDTYADVPQGYTENYEDMPQVAEEYQDMPPPPANVALMQGGMLKIDTPEPFVDGEGSTGAPF